MHSLLKYTSLAVIVIQTTTMVLVLRFSRTQTIAGPRYLSSSAVVASEFLKLLVCASVLLWENDGNPVQLLRQLHQEVWCKPKETCKMLVPAGLYTLQNNLLFLALSLLDAATFQVTYQLKILTTAMFSVVMMKKRLSFQQWIALLLLMGGVVLVQMPAAESGKQVTQGSAASKLLGLMAILASCVSSGFSSVYLEKLLKGLSQSLWVRNIQLAIFALVLGIVAMFLTDYQRLVVGGFFQGYNYITWAVIFLQAFGGLVVSLAVRYADSILKGFATSISIVLSALCSYFLLGDFLPTTDFLAGASLVIFSTIMYGIPVSSGSSK
uniref:Putative udp-n-acetylglucosamine transporter-like protein n=1 Tax=Ornithodoros turicata TaxID=34597 RepID=A0A2R5LNW1_9ACAR